MSYELINKELELYSCNVSDLTMEERNIYAEQTDSQLENLAMFCKVKEDKLILNWDNENFELYKEIASMYLSAGYEIRREFNKVRPKVCDGFINILDAALKNRKLNEVKEILNKVSEFKELYQAIAAMEDKEKQFQAMDILLNIDTEPLDIDTLYGWNEYVRRGNIKHLILEGILPTDDNLKRYQDEVSKEAEELNKNASPYFVPLICRGENTKKRFQSEVTV